MTLRPRFVPCWNHSGQLLGCQFGPYVILSEVRLEP